MSLAPGYWVCYSDETGARITGTEVQLDPAPAGLELPEDALGQVQETSDGNAITQTPTKDPRQRTWVWKNFPDWHISYKRLWPLLLSLHSKTRFQAGLSPYVYLLDNASGKSEKRQHLTVAVSSATSNTVTAASTLPNDTLEGGLVIVKSGPGKGLQGYITGRSGDTLTVSPAWATQPTNGSTIVVVYTTPAWFRARVTHVDRKVADDRATMYERTKIVWVPDDLGWNDK